MRSIKNLVAVVVMVFTLAIVGVSQPVEASYEITESSELSPGELENIIAGTGLSGLGYAFYDMEQNYGVNAVFAIAVAQLESGGGTSDMAIYDNNLFGMMGLSYGSQEACINDFGSLIRNYYFDRGLTTVYSINPVYCPDNYDWAPYVESLIYQNFARVGR